MKKKLSLFVFLLLANLTFAQNTIIWSVKKPNSEKTSYILGTFHQMGNSFVDKKPIIKELLSKSELIIFESVEDSKTKAEVEEVFLTREDDYSYRKILNQDDVQFLNNYSKDWKIPIHKLKPGELILKLHQEIVKEKCNTINTTDTFEQMEDYLQYLAEQLSVPILGLETYVDQMKLINSSYTDKEELSWDKAKNIIHQYITDANTDDKKRLKQICSIANNYMSMKLDYQFNLKCSSEDQLLTKRNDKWMPQILKSINDNKTVFIAVGLHHLYYDCGIISQLKKEGYEVKPIKLK